MLSWPPIDLLKSPLNSAILRGPQFVMADHCGMAKRLCVDHHSICLLPLPFSLRGNADLKGQRESFCLFLLYVDHLGKDNKQQKLCYWKEWNTDAFRSLLNNKERIVTYSHFSLKRDFCCLLPKRTMANENNQHLGGMCPVSGNFLGKEGGDWCCLLQQEMCIEPSTGGGVANGGIVIMFFYPPLANDRHYCFQLLHRHYCCCGPSHHYDCNHDSL